MRAAALAALLALAACGTPADPFCAGEFTLDNQSGRVVEQLYAGSDRDLLEPDVLRTGQSRRFQAQGASAARLRVVFDDGRAAEIAQANLCRISRVTVNAGGISAQ
jgi:hypothetical protein